jgi:hypothetical protein
MKNNVFLLGIFAAVLGVFSFTGCGTFDTTYTDTYSSAGIFGESVLIPLKDFESRGFVYKTFTFRIGGNGQISGEVFNYQDLLKLAEAKGADAIINITIDRQISRVTVTNSAFGEELSEEVTEETWRASALAIKYTNVITQGNVIVNRPGSQASGGDDPGDQENTGGGSALRLFLPGRR